MKKLTIFLLCINFYALIFASPSYPIYGENINKVLQKNDFNAQYISTKCPLCEEFFNTHVLIDTIAVLYTDKFKKELFGWK